MNYLNPGPPHTEEQHDYEDLEIYSEIPPQTPPGPAAQSSLPAASGGDYEFTICPAYVPVTSQGQGTEEVQYEVVPWIYRYGSTN